MTTILVKCLVIPVASFILGMIVGAILYYNIGTPKCKHDFEKIIDRDVSNEDKHCYHITVHMCKKCGKRKVTKV